MICIRCGKLLIEDRFMDWAARWRCLDCGHIHDSASVERYLKHQKIEIFFESTVPHTVDEAKCKIGARNTMPLESLKFEF